MALWIRSLVQKCPSQSPLCLKAEKSMWELAHHGCEGGSLTGSIVSDLILSNSPPPRRTLSTVRQTLRCPCPKVQLAWVIRIRADISRVWTSTSILRSWKIDCFALLEASRFGIRDALRAREEWLFGITPRWVTCWRRSRESARTH